MLMMMVCNVCWWFDVMYDDDGLYVNDNVMSIDNDGLIM